MIRILVVLLSLSLGTACSQQPIEKGPASLRVVPPSYYRYYAQKPLETKPGKGKQRQQDYTKEEYVIVPQEPGISGTIPSNVLNDIDVRAEKLHRDIERLRIQLERNN